jgi:ABC-type nitrate/sulfonate/bicarbonate transport system permease component
MQSFTRSLSRVLISNWLRLALSAVSIGVFLTIWWLASAYLRADWPFQGLTPSKNPELLPYWWDVLTALGKSFVTHPKATGGLFMSDHIAASMKRITIAFALALITAVPLGLLMGRSRNAHAVGRPIIELLRPIPPLAWVPIFLIVFKFFWGPIVIVFLGIFFPILLNVMLGARSVDPVLIDAARTLGAKRRAIFGKVVFPFTVPYLITGITVGLGIGWMCIVAAEMLGAVGGGVGYVIFAAAIAAQYDVMYAAMVLIGILSVLTTGIAGLVERWLYRWMGMK